MGYVHHYGLIQEGEDGKEQQHRVVSPQISVISWTKFILCNLLTAGLGALVTYLIMRNSTISKPIETTAVSAAASTTPSACPTIPTPSIEYVKQQMNSPGYMTGKILDCGGNPTEARARGCVYDVMMQDWVPEPCYDSVLTEKYLAAGNWTWYADGEGKTTMTDEQMRKGEHGAAWMSTSYHKAHCVFSWLKIIRALRNNRGISQELLSYDHVLHCSHGALKEDSNDEGLGVSAPTNYARCALYDTWLQDPIPDQHDSTQ